MSKCSIKGCKRGATTRIKLFEGGNHSKTKPVCAECYSHYSICTTIPQALDKIQQATSP